MSSTAKAGPARGGGIGGHLNRTTVVLRGELTAGTVAAQREQVMAALRRSSGGLVLDLGGIEAVDRAGVQLLLVTRLYLMERAAPLLLHAPSAAVVEALRRTGLAAEFGADGWTP